MRVKASPSILMMVLVLLMGCGNGKQVPPVSMTLEFQDPDMFGGELIQIDYICKFQKAEEMPGADVPYGSNEAPRLRPDFSRIEVGSVDGKHWISVEGASDQSAHFCGEDDTHTEVVTESIFVDSLNEQGQVIPTIDLFADSDLLSLDLLRKEDGVWKLEEGVDRNRDFQPRRLKHRGQIFRLRKYSPEDQDRPNVLDLNINFIKAADIGKLPKRKFFAPGHTVVLIRLHDRLTQDIELLKAVTARVYEWLADGGEGTVNHCRLEALSKKVRLNGPKSWSHDTRHCPKNVETPRWLTPDYANNIRILTSTVRSLTYDGGTGNWLTGLGGSYVDRREFRSVFPKVESVMFIPDETNREYLLKQYRENPLPTATITKGYSAEVKGLIYYFSFEVFEIEKAFHFLNR